MTGRRTVVIDGTEYLLVPIAKPKISADRIIEICEDYFGVDIGKMRSRSRKANLVLARQVTAYMLRKYSMLSQSRVADLVYRERTYVIHIERETNNRIDTNHHTASDILEVEKRIKQEINAQAAA